ncbi:MAG: hypothetical protein ACPGOY_14660 [Rhodospirillaceae bacterium]
MQEFPKEIQDFANHFLSLQEKRHKADYDPICTLSKEELKNLIEDTRGIIERFQKVDTKDRRAFAAYAIFEPSTVKNADQAER